MPSDDRSPRDDSIRSALEAGAAGLPEGDAAGAFDEVVRRGRARRRARRAVGGAVLALVVGVGLAGTVALAGGDDPGTELQVGNEQDDEPTPNEGAAVDAVAHPDLWLYAEQVETVADVARSECSNDAQPALLPTVGAVERDVVSRAAQGQHLDARWRGENVDLRWVEADGHRDLRAWSTAADAWYVWPVLAIEPIAQDAVQHPGRSEGSTADLGDEAIWAQALASGIAWIRCAPDEPLLRVALEVRGPAIAVVAAGDPVAVDPGDVASLLLFDDRLEALSPSDPPPVPDLPPDALQVEPWMVWDVASHWCADVGLDRPAGIELVLPSGTVDPGGSWSGAPVLTAGVDRPLVGLVRIQVVDASWDPTARPFLDSLGVARATYHVTCGDRTSPLHALAVKTDPVGGWSLRWGSERPPEFKPDGSLPAAGRPEPAWR